MQQYRLDPFSLQVHSPDTAVISSHVTRQTFQDGAETEQPELNQTPAKSSQLLFFHKHNFGAVILGLVLTRYGQTDQVLFRGRVDIRMEPYGLWTQTLGE